LKSCHFRFSNPCTPMRGLPVFAVLFVLMMFEPAFAKMYSRALREKWVADSLRRIDSVRITDSMHIADSLTVARYGQSDSIIAVERKQAAETPPPPVMPDTGVIPIPGEVDNLSGRTILIDPSNPYARLIDSLQKSIDSLNSALHDGDSRFKDMKGNSISERQRYIQFLLRNKMKDTSAVLSYCNGLFEIFKIREKLLFAIKNSQDPNTKFFIQRHIEKHKQKMADLNNFILALTPKLGSMPEKAPLKRLIEQ
jgi:hypothetical protein